MKQIYLGLILTLTFIVQPVYAQENSAPIKSDDFSHAIEKVAEIVGPTVVAIRTERVERYKSQYSFSGNPYEDELFQRFFEDFFGELPEYESRRRGLGSGVIINALGYILTNEHVVREVDDITVTLPDGREFKGEIKGTDPRADLAVIKIDAPDLPVAKLGDSTNLKIGQWVVAIGNPFGYVLHSPEPTVTAGVISALHRSLPQTSQRDTNYTDLIQTDAAINPGNSGGPLVNLAGEVVGINVAIFSTSGGYQGIGFAIPVNTAKRIVERLIAGKPVIYGWIGINVQDLDPKLAQYFGVKNNQGVLVAGVIKNGPAHQAGIKDGDIITSIDGQTVKKVDDLLRIINNQTVDQKVTVSILRDGQAMDLPVTIGSRPVFDQYGRIIPQKQEEKQEADASPQTTATINQWRGITVENIDPKIIERLRLEYTAGVVITELDEKSPAREAGLRTGDIITTVNKTKINNTRDFGSAVAKAKGDTLIRTVRGFFVVKDKAP